MSKNILSNNINHLHRSQMFSRLMILGQMIEWHRSWSSMRWWMNNLRWTLGSVNSSRDNCSLRRWITLHRVFRILWFIDSNQTFSMIYFHSQATLCNERIWLRTEFREKFVQLSFLDGLTNISIDLTKHTLPTP